MIETDTSEGYQFATATTSAADGSAIAAEQDDGALLALESQFHALAVDLAFAKRPNGELGISSDRRRSVIPPHVQTDVDAGTNQEIKTREVEAILARLCPIERAIMSTPARTIAGLGVKARHAAYVMSQYWSAPIDKIDWDAQAIRLLIEAVCDVANAQPPVDKSNVG